MNTAHSSLSNGVGYATDGLNLLFIKLYDVGSENKGIFFWLWWITIAYWIGYMFIWQVIKMDWWVIKKVKEKLKYYIDRRRLKWTGEKILNKQQQKVG